MRVVIVHTSAQAKAALAVACNLRRQIILQSAPAAIFYAGSLYLHNMYEEARSAYPASSSTFILDCSDARAEVISALRNGHRHLRLKPSDPASGKLSDIARQYGAAIHTGPYEALDLQQARDTNSACRKWLENHKEVA